MAFRVVGPGLAWIDNEPDGPRRRCVANFLLSLIDGAPAEDAIPLPGEEDLSVVSFVPGTDVVVTYMVVEELDRVFVDAIEPLTD
jgi:hypothetical protein